MTWAYLGPPGPGLQGHPRFDEHQHRPADLVERQFRADEPNRLCDHRRLHSEITEDNSYVTPAEFEAVYYRQNQPAAEAVTQ